MIKNVLGDPESRRKMRSAVRRLGRTLKTVLFLSPANAVLIPRKQLAVSIGAECLSFAHGSRFLNRIRISGFRTYRSPEAGRLAPDMVASTTLLYCSQANLTNPQVMLCIPKAWTVIRTTELPAAAGENLANVVSYELDRITPFGPDDAYYDYRLLKAEGGRLQIAVAALRRDTADAYIKALAEKGLLVTKISTNLAAVSTLMDYAWQEQDLIYLDIGSRSYEGGLIRSGVVVAGCADSFNGNVADEHLLADVAENVAPWIEQMEKWNIPPQLAVRAYNGFPCTPLERRLRIPLHRFTNDNSTIPGLKREKAGDDLAYDAVGGVLSALWTKSKAMNLLQRGRATSAPTPMTATFILMAILCLLGILVLLLPLHLENEKVAAVDREIAVRKDAVKKIESLRKDFNGLEDEFKAIADFKQGKQNTLEILKEMTVILPKSVWLTRVHLSGANVSIEGYATSATDILPRIEASPFFSKAEFSSPTMRDARMNMDRFVIRMELEGVKKEESKAKDGKKQ